MENQIIEALLEKLNGKLQDRRDYQRNWYKKAVEAGTCYKTIPEELKKKPGRPRKDKDNIDPPLPKIPKHKLPKPPPKKNGRKPINVSREDIENMILLKQNKPVDEEIEKEYLNKIILI